MANGAELIGASAGYLFSGSEAENVYTAAQVAKSGSLNNYLAHDDQWAREQAKEALAVCKESGTCSEGKLASLKNAIAFFDTLDEKSDAALKAACESDQSSVSCTNAIRDALVVLDFIVQPVSFPSAGDLAPLNSYRDLERYLNSENPEARERAQAIYKEYEQSIELINAYPQAVELAYDLYSTELGWTIAIEALGGGLGALVPMRAKNSPTQKNLNSTNLGATNRTLSQIDDYLDLTDFRRTHILNGHRAGAGKPGKTEFPSNWSDDGRVTV